MKMKNKHKQIGRGIYPDFNNVIITETKGVSPVGNDTKVIALNAARLKPKLAIDMGSGTGFIPIFLKKRGINCDGADINPAAIENARKNAKRNKLKINFYQSNLFSNVRKKYDLIMFNPPYGSTKSAASNKLLEIIKSFIPKGTIITKLAYPFISRGRKKLIERFFQEARGHLTKKGGIIILLDNLEIGLLKNKRYRILDSYGKGKLVLV